MGRVCMRVLLAAILSACLLAGPVPGGRVGVEPDGGKTLGVVGFGARSDDPASGGGGLIALQTKDGHEVVVAYATCYRGQRKVGSRLHATGPVPHSFGRFG